MQSSILYPQQALILPLPSLPFPLSLSPFPPLCVEMTLSPRMFATGALSSRIFLGIRQFYFGILRDYARSTLPAGLSITAISRERGPRVRARSMPSASSSAWGWSGSGCSARSSVSVPPLGAAAAG